MSTVALMDVKSYIGAQATGSDAELQGFIDGAETAIEQRTGPLSPRQVTVQTVCLNGRLVLPVTPYIGPVTKATNVLMGGVDYDQPGALLEFVGGVLSLPFGAAMLPGTWTLTYMAGWDQTPGDLVLAVKEEVRHLWAIKRGNSFRNGTEVVPGTAHALPMRVEELIEPYLQDGVA